MSILTKRTALAAGAVATAVILSVGGVAVAQATIDNRPASSTTTTPTPSPTPSSSSSSDDGPLHDLNDDHGGLRPDGVSDDGPLHDLNDDHGGNSGDNSGHGSDDSTDDNSGHGSDDN